jgi:hypothetical protein
MNEYIGDPWTIGTEVRLRAANPNVFMISLLVDEAGALLIAKGIVPAYVQQQAKDALTWAATEERTPEHQRSIFEDIHTETNSDGHA